jgi:hypothetical protein
MEAERSARKGERGRIRVAIAIGLIGAGSLAIDIGSALVTNSSLQNVADAATPSHDGVSVQGRRDDSTKGEPKIQLARVVGINQIAITAESTAAISAMGSLKAGKGEFPTRADQDWFDAHDCSTNDTMKFLPTSSGASLGDSGRASR